MHDVQRRGQVATGPGLLGEFACCCCCCCCCFVGVLLVVVVVDDRHHGWRCDDCGGGGLAVLLAGWVGLRASPGAWPSAHSHSVAYHIRFVQTWFSIAASITKASPSGPKRRARRSSPIGGTTDGTSELRATIIVLMRMAVLRSDPWAKLLGPCVPVRTLRDCMHACAVVVWTRRTTATQQQQHKAQQHKIK